MSNSLTEEKLIEVRYTFPEDVHKKIKSHKRKLSVVKDADVSMEVALIDYIRNSKSTKL